MNLIPEAAIWRGKPNRFTVLRIQSITQIDSRGRRLYKDAQGSWRRLSTARDFQELNWQISRDRNMI
jgi:hypothetical protein